MEGVLGPNPLTLSSSGLKASHWPTHRHFGVRASGFRRMELYGRRYEMDHGGRMVLARATKYYGI